MTQEKLWIRGLQQGDAESLREVYLAYKDELLSLGIVLGRDQALAEDALQDVFVQLACNGSSLKIRKSLRAYLLPVWRIGLEPSTADLQNPRNHRIGLKKPRQKTALSGMNRPRSSNRH